MVLKNDWATGDAYTADDQNDVADQVNANTDGIATAQGSLDSKVDKTATANRVYATNNAGTQTTMRFASSASELTLVYRSDDGVTSVGEPTDPTHATTKGYVDTAVSGLQTELDTKLDETEVDARVTIGTASLEDTSNKGTANGYAGLDSGGKVPIGQLPSSIMEYQGVWNASTNSPTLADGSGDNGDVYRVSTAGTRNLGGGSITFAVGDYAIYNGSTWEKSDTTDAVASVAGKTGVVTLAKADVGLGNVDNTSSATERAEAATLTNKTIDGEDNTLSNIPKTALASAVQTSLGLADTALQDEQVIIGALPGSGVAGKLYVVP